jgi:poly-gamma-glutamate synthesis protein (capsule biosynthesis protein)
MQAIGGHARRVLAGGVLAVTALLLSLPVPSAAPAGGSTPAAAATLPVFSSSVSTISATLATRMRYSWRAGCPVPRSDLRYLRMTYYGFDGLAHRGEMVVHRTAATKIISVFRRAYNARFPIYRMRLVDDYRGSDDASMAANNTSAFNCRRTSGGTAWSQHSYGRAVDVNPVQNPYVSGGVVEPPAGKAYVTRSPLRKGMVTWTVRDAFADIGWYWGGAWRYSKDYQHFSSNNR